MNGPDPAALSLRPPTASRGPRTADKPSASPDARAAAPDPVDQRASDPGAGDQPADFDAELKRQDTPKKPAGTSEPETADAGLPAAPDTATILLAVPPAPPPAPPAVPAAPAGEAGGPSTPASTPAAPPAAAAVPAAIAAATPALPAASAPPGPAPALADQQPGAAPAPDKPRRAAPKVETAAGAPAPAAAAADPAAKSAEPARPQPAPAPPVPAPSDARVALPDPGVGGLALTPVANADWRLSIHAATEAGPRDTASHPAATAQSVIGQISLAVGKSDDRRLEIRLDPPELGRVHIHLTPTDQGLQATVVAERPETHALLRRHGDALARDLGAAGYGSVTLDFAAGGRETPSEGDRRPPAAATETYRVATTAPATTAAPPPASRTAADGALDIRL